jgi:hypothetical protein
MQLPIASPLKCHIGWGGKPIDLYYVYYNYAIKTCFITAAERHVQLCFRVAKRY